MAADTILNFAENLNKTRGWQASYNSYARNILPFLLLAVHAKAARRTFSSDYTVRKLFFTAIRLRKRKSPIVHARHCVAKFRKYAAKTAARVQLH